MKATVAKIAAILRSSYNTKSYVELVSEVFPHVQLVAPDRFNPERTGFSSHIEGSIHIGNYIAPDKKKIVLMAVQLKSAGYVENSRSSQRSYAKRLIENGNADAALIAFYTKGDAKWRLSLVRLDYEVKFEQGRLKTVERITPAKRYSYLVGENEPCHTAISRFKRFIIDSQANPEYPTLEDLEEAFSVEKVTNEFFSLYCEKFHQLREVLESIEDFSIEAEQHNFSSAQFAKKLMGQIVFLYFLQKKGWLGVCAWPATLSEQEYKEAFYAQGTKSRTIIPKAYLLCSDGKYHLNEKNVDALSDDDAEILAHCVKGAHWGTGPRSFMRLLFNKAINDQLNFYHDVLEPLFYATLNTKRGAQSYCKFLRCRIPFLSGGLFEPINGYDWKHNEFLIPNEVFSNALCKDREADGILDIFDRYNFTMAEDEPMEREVAIDPEMLGKVFENLLEVKDRKSLGAFYTPREIVRFMCRESLADYLARKVDVPYVDVKTFLNYGDLLQTEDTARIVCNRGEELLIPKSLYELGAGGTEKTNKLEAIDEALATVRILDPAVGSGAFPLCMVNEIVQIRQNISAYLSSRMEKANRAFYLQSRSPYRLKYATIRDCIFAVDNDPSAIDITQLRLWLSLVIDEDVSSDMPYVWGYSENPMPLPTLDKNILCGNSLVGVCGTMSPYAPGGVIKNVSTEIQHRLQMSGLELVHKRLYEEQEKLFTCDDPDKRAELRNSIQACKNMLISGHATSEELRTYAEISKRTPKPLVLWQIDFADVFFSNGGFDIVIGNPPYVQLQKSVSENSIEKVGDQYAPLGYSTFAKSGDLYCLFFEMGIRLLRHDGCLCYITSNKWMRTAYGQQLRKYFLENTNPKVLIDFSGTKVFETAGVDVSIALLTRGVNRKETAVCTIKEPVGVNLDAYLQENYMIVAFDDAGNWSILPNIEETIRQKIQAIGKPISDWKISIKYGIKTCLNKVYVIDEATKNKLCEEDPRSIEILSPVLRGRDINKWSCNFRNLWLVAVHNGIHKYNIPPIDIDKYPAVKNYLTPHMAALKKKIDQGVTPYHLKNCTYYEEYSLPKIVFQEIEQSPSFALDVEGKYMCVDTVRIVTGERLEYLVALFNSNLFFFAVKHFLGGGALGDTGVRMKHTFFKSFTAYVPSAEEEAFIKEVVLSARSDRDMIINDFFYKKYNLSADEIDYIEADMK